MHLQEVLDTRKEKINMDENKFKETYAKFNILMKTDKVFDEVFSNPEKYSYDTLEKEVLNKIGLNAEEYLEFAKALFNYLTKKHPEYVELILEDEYIREDVREYLFGDDEDEVKYKN